jgi:osmotically-inducible protein OsmY
MRHPRTKTDSDILHDVACELAWDTRISPTEIGLQVKDAVVTLTGTVDSWAKLRAAEDAAHRVKGVLDVANDLVVKLPGNGHQTDTEIAVAVRRALEWDVTVPDQSIQSTVSRGMVTLQGVVAHWSERADAERAVERLKGVKRVINRIEIEPTKGVDVAQAHRAVKSALERHAEREASGIDLQVADGTVNVTGVVHTWQEKEAVLGAVRATRGVREVSDHVRVETRS